MWSQDVFKMASICVFQFQDRLKEQGVSGVTLKWREQPDGKVFHKEGKEEKKKKRKKTELWNENPALLICNPCWMLILYLLTIHYHQLNRNLDYILYRRALSFLINITVWSVSIKVTFLPNKTYEMSLWLQVYSVWTNLIKATDTQLWQWFIAE